MNFGGDIIAWYAPERRGEGGGFTFHALSPDVRCMGAQVFLAPRQAPRSATVLAQTGSHARYVTAKRRYRAR